VSVVVVFETAEITAGGELKLNETAKTIGRDIRRSSIKTRPILIVFTNTLSLSLF